MADASAAERPAAHRPKLHIVYFILAGFDLLTALVSLLLVDQITGIYQESVNVSQWWADRLGDFANLSLLAGEANAPGNNVFEEKNRSEAAPLARDQMRAGAAKFRDQLSGLRRAIEQHAPRPIEPSVMQQLLAGCELADSSMNQMVSEGEQIFASLADSDNLDLAGQFMAKMDQRYGRVTAALDNLGNQALGVQQRHFIEQAATVTSFRNFEFVIAALIILMVGGVTVYGHKLAQQMKSTARAMELSVIALRDSEARIRAVVESALDGIITVSRDGRCESLNPAASQLFGYASHEIEGHSIGLLLPTVGGTKDHVHSGEILATIGSNPMEIEARRKGGERFPAELVVSRARLTDRQFFTCMVRDITERKRNEAELQRHRQHLESLVDERTTQLEASHQQLRLAERLASIGTLAAGLGHDMNNVLFPVRCRLDALHTAELGANVQAELGAVRQAVDYLQQLCDGLRLLALDPDDPNATTGTTELMVWWREIKPILVSALPNDIDLQTQWPSDLPAIAVPPHRLTQAIFNLVVNAGEATARDGVVTIAATLLEDRRFVRITVNDTGRGMTAEEKRRALDPFFTTKKRGLSTGLGLSLVHGVAQAAGGMVEIESQPGQGTTVAVMLPVATATARPPAPTQSVAASVTLRDRRLATFVAALLKSQGIDVQFTDAAPHARSSVWITEPTEERLLVARRFVSESRNHRLVLFGKIPGDWRQIAATIVDESRGLDAIRGALQAAVSPRAGSTT